MKFEKAMNERVEDEVYNLSKSDPEAFARFQSKAQAYNNKSMAPLAQKGIVKIEFGGRDNDNRGTKYGDRLIVYKATVDGVVNTSVNGKVIRFDANVNTKSDAIAIASALMPADSIFARQLSNFLIRIHNDSIINHYSIVNSVPDIVYDKSTGNFVDHKDV